MKELTFDGSFIGDLDHRLDEVQMRILGKTISELRCKVDDYTVAFYKKNGSANLIIDELKYLFNIQKIGKNSCKLNGTEVILARTNEKETFLSEYEGEITPEMLSDIRNCYLFRWCLGLTSNDDRSLAVISSPNKNPYITSVKEIKVCYQKSKISRDIINRWFDGDREIFNSLLNEKFSKRIAFHIRSEISDVIRRIDSDEIYWVYLIMNRIYSKIEIEET